MSRLNKFEVQRAFGRSARNYADEAQTQKYLARRLINFFQSELRKINRAVSVLDAACGSSLNAILPNPIEQLIGVDIAMQMLQQLKNDTNTQHKHTLLCADLEMLPLASRSMDIVFSNASLHWCPSPLQVLAEFHRVLKEPGWVLFSSYGPQTLCELRHSWQTIDATPHTLDFPSMQQLLNGLTQCGFRVMNCWQQREVVLYEDVMALLLDLKRLGANNLHKKRFRGLYSNKKMAAMIKQYTERYSTDQKIPASYELFFFCAGKD